MYRVGSRRPAPTRHFVVPTKLGMVVNSKIYSFESIPCVNPQMSGWCPGRGRGPAGGSGKKGGRSGKCGVGWRALLRNDPFSNKFLAEKRRLKTNSYIEKEAFCVLIAFSRSYFHSFKKKLKDDMATDSINFHYSSLQPMLLLPR